MTDLGNMMQPLLEQSLDAAITAKEQAESYGKAEIAHLRLGLSKSVEIHTLESVIAEMTKAMPDLEITLTRGTAKEVEQSLEDGDIDLAITAKDEDAWDRINQWPLYTEEFVVALNPEHPLSNKPNLRLSDLENQIIVNRTHCEGFGGFSKLLEQESVNARFAHNVTTEADLEFLLSRNFGIGVIPNSIEFNNGDLLKLKFEDAQYHRSLFLLAVAGRKHSKPATLFVKLLRVKDWSVGAN